MPEEETNACHSQNLLSKVLGFMNEQVRLPVNRVVIWYLALVELLGNMLILKFSFLPTYLSFPVTANGGVAMMRVMFAYTTLQ